MNSDAAIKLRLRRLRTRMQAMDTGREASNASPASYRARGRAATPIPSRRYSMS